MPTGLLFWILMVMWVVFWGYGRTPGGQLYWGAYNGWLLFALMFLIGWRVFGFALYN